MRYFHPVLPKREKHVSTVEASSPRRLASVISGTAFEDRSWRFAERGDKCVREEQVDGNEARNLRPEESTESHHCREREGEKPLEMMKSLDAIHPSVAHKQFQVFAWERQIDNNLCPHPSRRLRYARLTTDKLSLNFFREYRVAADSERDTPFPYMSRVINPSSFFMAF